MLFTFKYVQWRFLLRTSHWLYGYCIMCLFYFFWCQNKIYALLLSVTFYFVFIIMVVHHTYHSLSAIIIIILLNKIYIYTYIFNCLWFWEWTMPPMTSMVLLLRYLYFHKLKQQLIWKGMIDYKFGQFQQGTHTWLTLLKPIIKHSVL